MGIKRSFDESKNNCKKSLRSIEFKQKKPCKGYREIEEYLNSLLREFSEEEKTPLPEIMIPDLVRKIESDTSGIFSVTNNYANWENKDKGSSGYQKEKEKYQELAKKIDDQESEEMKKGTVDEEKEWQLDSGLMANLARKNAAGNCDDLASFALNEALKQAKWCVAAFVQDRDIDHSFVLLSSTQGEVYYLDIWVPTQRSGVFPKIFSNQTDVYCAIVRGLNFSDSRTLIEMYNERIKINPVNSSETPRFDQVGKYIQEKPPF